MNPRLALALDTICWTSLTAALAYFGYTTAAFLVGGFAVFYVYRCVKVMLRIMQIEQRMQEFDAEEFLNDE